MKKVLASMAIFIGLLFTPPLYAEETMDAIFAMGCFWCGETEFRDHLSHAFLPGITNIRVGYAGGTKPNPTYESHEGYKEALKVTYDPSIISYEKLLDIFWHNVDLFDADGQFCDKGYPYTAVIYTQNAQQQSEAAQSKKEIEKLFDKPVDVPIVTYTTFYDAEEYHQNYQAKNPARYKYYRWSCGRDQRLKQIWDTKNNHGSL